MKGWYKMTDNEKLELILTEVQEIKQKINRIETGQAEIKREIFKVERKISDTYNLALDAWGASEENKLLIESEKATAI